MDQVKMTNGQKVLREGLIAGSPICLGYIPLGLALGVVAQKAGLAPIHVGLMSLLVFAGSAQFIAISMLVSGADPLSIIVTTFVVNIRHLLLSASLAVHLKGVHRILLSLFAYGVTDESFAINISHFRLGGWGLHQAMIVNTIANFTWIASTVLGCWAGELIPAGDLRHRLRPDGHVHLSAHPSDAQHISCFRRSDFRRSCRHPISRNEEQLICCDCVDRRRICVPFYSAEEWYFSRKA